MKKIFISVLVLVVWGLSIFGALKINTMRQESKKDSVTAASQQVAEYVSSNKIEEAYEMAGPSFKESVTLEDFKNSMAGLSSDDLNIGGINEVYEGYGDYMVQFYLEGKTTTSDGGTEVDSSEVDDSTGGLTIFMVNVDGKWQFRDIFITT